MSKVLESVVVGLRSRGYDVTVEVFNKNNGTRVGVKIPCGDGLAAVIYEDQLEEIAEDMNGVSEAIEEILNRIDAAKPENIDEFSSVSYVLQHSFWEVCKTSWNQGRLDGVIHEAIPGTDLTKILRVDTGNRSYVFPRKMIDSWNLNGYLTEELLKANADAELDTNVKVATMEEMLGLHPMEKPFMVVLTTDNPLGARAILNKSALDKARFMLDSEEIFLIPSSIHEIIATSSNGLTAQEMGDMVRSVNGKMVLEKERLSDRVYRYSGKEIFMD